MFTRLIHPPHSSLSHEQHPFNKENGSYNNIQTKPQTNNPINFRKVPSTDHLFSMHSDNKNQIPRFLKSSLSNYNLHEKALNPLTQSQEVNYLRESQTNILSSSHNFASIKMGLKSSINRQLLAAEKISKKQGFEDIMKSSIRGCEMATSVKMSEIPCSSQDGKRAKYRLIQSKDPENMYYCSKCSIALIQQGYRVQQISSNKIDLHKRKQQLQNLCQKLQHFQDKMRKQSIKLECDRYSDSLQQRLLKMQEIYDVAIQVIQQMKARDFQTTTKSIEQANRAKRQEINILKNQLHRMAQIKKHIHEIMDHTLKELSQTQYKSILDDNMSQLKTFQNYKPLVLSVKQESVQKVLSSIFSEISNSFQSARIGGCNLSGISSKIIEEQQEDFTLSDLKQKPFRNLFSQNDISFNC